jgi:L-iditol 2-dehydrogenase
MRVVVLVRCVNGGTKMKSVVLTGIRRAEVREDPTPRIQKDTDVLLRIGAVGVCGSDVHYYDTGRIGSQVVKYPYRVGHECSATVEEVGSAVASLKPGDRVAVDPAAWCNDCDQCRVGRFHTCRNLTFLGTPGQADGCFCEYIVMPEASCFPVKPSTSLEQAALVEPLSIGVYAVQQSIPLAGARVGILGCGPIGLSVMLAAQLQGPERFFVTDKINDRLGVARRAGAHWAGNPDDEDVVAAISSQEPLLLDVVFECCGQQDALDQAVELLKPGGKLMLIGIPQVDRVSFSIDQIRRKEICIQNVRRQNECVQTALDLLESGKIDADFMITHRFGLEQTQQALDLVDSYGDGVIKAMVLV